MNTKNIYIIQKSQKLIMSKSDMIATKIYFLDCKNKMKIENLDKKGTGKEKREIMLPQISMK